MTRTVLLRLDDEGAPFIGSNAGVNKNGVISLPSIPTLDGNDDEPIFILQMLIVAGSSIANNGTVWTNFPPDYLTPFDRSHFYKHVIEETTFNKDSYIDIPIYKSGAFAYYVSYESIVDEISGEQSLITTRRFYINVPPSLSINGEHLPLNSISLQSMISKWMGKDWEPYFQMVKDKGYNMIHFTPLQQRGESESPYSIYDQLTFDPSFFKTPLDVKLMTSMLQKKYQILSLTDIVWNHTANNSAWIRDHPDAGYNAETAPHLVSAIELDKLLLLFSKVMHKHGFPTVIKSTDDLLHIMEGVKIHLLGDLKLWEYYVLDVEWHQSEVEKTWNQDNVNPSQEYIPDDIKSNLASLLKFIIKRCTNNGSFMLCGERLGNKLEITSFIGFLKLLYPELNSYKDVEEHVLQIIDEINLPLYKEYDDDLGATLEQLYNRIKYLRLDSHGPQLGEITEEKPLAEPYFTYFTSKDGKEWALANNGWIWSGNPLVDFASNKSKSYLRREVIVWGDCIKLRYGSKPEDSPYLWSRMIKYTELCASIFDGFRIDNCHSTPLHVGEALLDAARRVNPSLYVVAELFTGSEEMDKLVVERLAINSLIREAMQAWSVEEFSRLLHRHGGRPIGSLKWLPLDEFLYPIENDGTSLDKVSEIPIAPVLTATSPHALFMDCTHDNETPYDKRTVEDTLPNAALVSFCASATGTVFGFDECYPHLLDVVNEKRKYNLKSDLGIVEVKKKLNEIRKIISQETMGLQDDNEMHLHHEGQYITFHRTNPRTGRGYFLVARTKFNPDGDQRLGPITLAGSKVRNEFCYSLEKIGDVKEGEEFIEPVPTKLVELETPILEFDELKNETRIIIPDNFPQGSIAVFSTYIEDCDEELDNYVRSGAMEACDGLTLIDLNAILFRCESEERDSSGGNDGVYDVPNYGKLVYAGLQGWISLLRDVILDNNLAHPIIEHLRQGEWALDFVVARLRKYQTSPTIENFAEWLTSRMERIKIVPFFLRPRYFLLVVGIAYEACRFKALSLMSKELFHGGTHFIQCLAMTSVQMIGKMKSTSLKPFTSIPCMAAGLPHFSYDYMRCWGRDVFISLRGLTLATGRFDAAKDHILGFAATLKHGLIPNLLDAGRNPRFNSRDAAWFFLQAIQDYITVVPGGESILKEKVKRRFPLNDKYIKFDDEEAFSYETSIEDVIYEILSRHALGIKYRELNAGINLDSQMKDEGFNVEIQPDWSTGFVHGGNQWNCGTWMDKMGESARAGNKGWPGTPRDGADVEIIGLLKSCLRFVIELNKKSLFQYDEVTKSDGSKIKFVEWESLIQDNFEKCFYVPENESDDGQYDVNPSIINRRGIYKDIYKSGKPYEDYQLRPNFAIAMSVAPELFTPLKALKALQLADKVIRGPVGMRTLDPSDYNYRPYYLNSVDNDDFATSKGRNYHQGPEWVWCYGYFMRAYVKFHMMEHERCINDEDNAFLHQLLGRRLIAHRRWINDSPWVGLAELTQKDGEYCNDSSPTQAWSTSCLMDLFLDLKLS